jgi:hypothetical protein
MPGKEHYPLLAEDEFISVEKWWNSSCHSKQTSAAQKRIPLALAVSMILNIVLAGFFLLTPVGIRDLSKYGALLVPNESSEASNIAKRP